MKKKLIEIPTELFEKIVRLAKKNDRSVNKEITNLLKKIYWKMTEEERIIAKQQKKIRKYEKALRDIKSQLIDSGKNEILVSAITSVLKN